MYAGHHEDGSGIQKHSAGELYPLIIIGYGDGTWRWVDQQRKAASPRIPNQHAVVASAKVNLLLRDKPATKAYRDWYKSYSKEQQ